MNYLTRFNYIKNYRKHMEVFSALLLKIFSTLSFVGLGLAAVYYYTAGKKLMVFADILSMAAICIILLCYYKQKLGMAKALLFSIAAAVVNIYVSIIYEAVWPREDSAGIILFLTCSCIIHCFISGMACSRYVPLAISAGIMLCYAFACITPGDAVLLQRLPVLALIFTGLSVSFIYFDIWYKRMIGEQEQVTQLFMLDTKQWDMVKDYNLGNDEIGQLLHQMGNRMKEKVINQAKVLVYQDEEISEALKEKYPCLTNTELKVCCHIMRGQTVGDICKIRNVSPSTVTSIRCRIRKKINLEKNDNLQSFLQALVHKKHGGKARQ